jgi:peptide/nickel transport system substrate-binding protein
MSKRYLTLVAFLLLVAAVLAACGGETVVEVTRVVTETEVVQAEPEVIEVTRVIEGEVETVEVTRVVEVEAASEEELSRMGGWLDTIVILEEPNADAGMARLIAGDIDMYADDVGGSAAATALASPEIQTRVQYGLYDELTFNTTVCADENLLNPFNNRAIREAMNWIIDRDYVANELYNGLAVPKYTTIAEAGADRGRFAAEIRAIENNYGYDFDRAAEVINSEMEAMGATLEGGVWTYNGSPVNLIFLIRIEDTRLEIGNYISNQLEDLGFTVERVERTSGELSPLWISSDPLECLWNVYTGAWSQTAISRSDVDNFEYFYTPRGLNSPTWAAYEVTPEFDDLALRLATNDFTSMEQRAEMTQEALFMAAENANRVWITSRTTLLPFSNDVSVTTDLAAGISGAALWSKTVRFVDRVGGSMTIGLPSVFTEPWNPRGGSNWVFDNMVKRGISDLSFYADPNTGLLVPGKAEGADVVIQEGFPAGATYDWVNLTFEPEIVVPDDAWAAWDAENQVFLTAAEVYTEPQTSVFKSTVYYPSEMFDATWHDGSPISAADFVMRMIMYFDQANEASPYYDEALVPEFNSFIAAFKGVRIASTDPLVIEHWGDDAQLDAENTLYSYYPSYRWGDETPWHTMALMLSGYANQKFAFTDARATEFEVERISTIGGPSLAILAEELEIAAEAGFIPFAPTLGDFITAEEAAERYSNIAEFARRYGHYYAGTGIYIMTGVFPVEGQAVLTHNPAHPDPALRWAGFAAPALAQVEIDGPGRVVIGEEAVFDVFIDNPVTGGPYAMNDIDSVSFLLFDATGAQVAFADAEAVEDGLWQVTLGSDITGELEEGSNRLEIVAVSKLVALPGLGNFEFVTAP